MNTDLLQRWIPQPARHFRSRAHFLFRPVLAMLALALLLFDPPSMAGDVPISCELYPIGLSELTLRDATPGLILDDLFEGAAPGHFGWLSWSGSPSAVLLERSLVPPGNSLTYVNPDEPQDRVISAGDWVSAKPGVSNSRGVRDALDALLSTEIILPVWDKSRGAGAHAQCRIAAFARVRLLDYRLGGQGRIRAQFLGFASCGEVNRPPTVDAGPDQAVLWGEPLELTGSSQDDGLPSGAETTCAWSQVDGPGTATFESPNALSTHVHFDMPGSYRLRLEVSDSELTGMDEVTVAVDQPNRPPVGFPLSLDILEDEPVDIVLEGIDPDGDPLTFQISTPPARGALTGDPPQLRYLPLPDFSGSDSFAFVVSDGELNSPETAVTVTILPVNDPPIADAQVVTLLEDESIPVTLTGTDLEGSPLSYIILEWPEHGSLDGAPPDLIYTPEPDFSGTDPFSFQVNDGELNSAPANVVLVVQPVNDPPLVSAGLDQAFYLDQSGFLAAEVTDDGMPPDANLEIHWSVVSGPGVAYFDHPGSLTDRIWFDAPGTYVLRLTAHDSELSAFDELTINVLPRNAPPIVNAGPDQLIPFPATVSLHGTVSDDGLPEAAVLVTVWEKADGPGAVTFTQPHALITQASFDTPGRYRLRLTATDSELSASDDLEITVNQMPTANAGPDLIATVGLPIQFRGSVTDDDLPSGQINVAWNRLDGPAPGFLVQPDALETEALFLVSGEYHFRLTATDGHLSASDDLRVLVRPAGENLPPIVDAGPDCYVARTNQVRLSGSATDDGLPLEQPLLVSWLMLEGPGEVEFNPANQTNALARFISPGVYTLQLTATDAEFTVSDTVTLSIYPDNQPPVVNAGSDQTILSGPALLTGIVTDDALPAGGALSFLWDRTSGPGEVRWDTPDQPTAHASFSEPGVYVLRLTASDSEFEANDTVTITVTGNQPPWVNAGPDQLLDLFVPGQSPPSTTLYPPLPINWEYAIGQPGLAGSYVSEKCLASSGTDLYVGGSFSTAGGVQVRSLAKWDGCSFSPLYDPRPINPNDPNSAPIGFIAHSGTTATLDALDAEVFVSGGFLRDLNQDGFLDFTARWTGTGWEHWAFKLASSSVSARVFLATPDAVYFGGRFKFQTSNVPTAPVSFNLAKWNGQDWERLGDGIRDIRDTPERTSTQYALVNDLALAPNGDLYAGGRFITETPTGLATNLARWNGSDWAPVGDGALAGCQGTSCRTTVHAITFDPHGDLYVGGDFTTAGDLGSPFIARWDGIQWWPVGDGFNGTVYGLTWHGADLYAGGDFTRAGSLLVNRLARWDGTQWQSLENGVSSHVYAVASTPSGVYAGGAFTFANGQPSNLIGKWGHEERISVTGPDPVTVPLAATAGAQVPITLELEHPCGRSLTVTWSVDGADPAQIDQLDDGATAEPIPLTFDHLYPPGAHTVVAVLDDGIGEPVLFSTTVTVLTPATTTLEGWVRDDGLPADGSLATLWESAAAPAPVLLEDPTQPITIASFTHPGSYQLQLSANDSEFTVNDQIEIAVRPFGELNLPPTAHAGRDRTVLRSDQITLAAVALDDALPGPDLQLDWVQLDGPATVALEPLPLADLATDPAARSIGRNATVSFALPGQYRFRCVANDTQFSRSDEVVIHVLDLVNYPPTATAGPHQFIGLSSEAILFASAQDDGLPMGTLLTGWSQIDGPGSAEFHRENQAWLARFSLPGDYILRFTAHDGALTAHADVRVAVLDHVPGPSVQLDSPTDGERITAPREISGAVAGELLSSWQLVARPATVTPLSHETLPPGIVLAQGQTPIQGYLGELDPTLLPNGLYELRLQATDLLGHSATTDPIAITLEGQLKPGLFSLAFTDLSIPVAGLPVQIIRTYDSRRARLGQPGDFGVGWHLDLSTVSLRKNRHLGRNWEQSDPGGWYQLDPVRPREVAITFPNDRVCRFQARLAPNSQFGYPIATAELQFISLPGTLGQLEIDGPNLASIDGFTGLVNLIDLGTFADFNPTRFRYLTPEGDTYVVDELAGLQSVADRHGNRLTIDADGIHHSSGVSIQVVRDPEGYITEIIDPAGNTLRYHRDPDHNLSQVTARDGLTTRLLYDHPDWPHLLSQVIDPRGIPALRADYDDAGRMIRQTDAQGHAFEFDRDPAHRHEIIRDRSGHATLFEYDERGNVTRRTDPLGGITTFAYDDFDNLLRRVNPLGHATTFTYDAQFNLRSQTDPLGHTSHYTYDPFRRLTSVTDPRGSTIAYSYDTRLIRVTDPAGVTTAFGLSPAGLVASITNAFGDVTTFDYDNHGRLSRETRPNNRTTTFIHDDLGRPVQLETAHITAEGAAELLRVRLEYDSGDRITRAVDPDGAQTRLHYDATGRLDRQHDPLDRQTSFLYDPTGRHVQTTFADLAFVQFAHDPDGRLIAVTNALGQVTRLTRDPLGRPTGVVHSDGATASAQYDLAGNLVALTDPRGATTLFGYDPASQLVAITNALGEITRFEYDPNGNQTAIRNAAGHQTNFEYDPLNRLVAIRHPDGSSELFDYDALGRRVATTDQVGLTTWFGYNPEGLLSSVTNAAGNVTRFDYDALGRCTSQIDAAGNVTRYQYHPTGRLSQRILPNGQSESFAYDLAGNLTAHTDFNGRTTTYAYDALDRLLEKIPDPAFGASSIAYTYDEGGRRATMADATGVTRYEYDPRNRCTLRSWRLPGIEQPLTLEYDHDPAGNLVSLRSAHPNGVNLRYQYDALNRLSQVTDPSAPAAPLTTTYTYDPAGDLASITLPNDLFTLYQHDRLHRLTNSVAFHPASGARAEFSYTLAPTGHRLTALSSISTDPVPRRHEYAYDHLHQLTGETLDANQTHAHLAYAYDTVGNRLSRSVSGPGFGSLANTTHLYDPNHQLLTDHYDANGNTVQSTLPAPLNLPVTDLYDFENRLAQRRLWIDGQAWSIDQLHDGDGRRAVQSVNGTTTYYLVDDLNPTGHAQVLEELVLTDNTLTPIRVHAFGHALLHQEQLTVGPDNSLQWQLRFHGADAHGNVRYLTDPAGAVTDTWDYDAFGNVIDRAGQSDNLHLFAGERWDPNLELYGFRARLYQPENGRFRTRDPFAGVRGDPSSLHPYLFAANDPVNRLDPTGHFSAVSMSLGVTYGLSLRNMYNGVALQVGYGLIQTLENLADGRSDEQVVLDYFLASTRDMALGFGTAYAAHALWPALVRVASQPLASVAHAYSKSSAALLSWRNGTILSARELVEQSAVAHLGSAGGTAKVPQHVFWSGGSLAEDAAQAFAGKHHGVVVGDTPAGTKLTELMKNVSWEQAKPHWIELSEEFAKTASGEVNVFQNAEGLFLDSIWCNEYKILTQNPNVTKINYHVVMPDHSVVKLP